jgi:hypothetical protein
MTDRRAALDVYTHIVSARDNQQRYPLAIIALYGPDATRATKLVASVVKDRRNPGADELQTWTVDSGDIRQEASIAEQVDAWLRLHRVGDTVFSDRIIGCPHEEGVDYPMGRTCPACPFWANIDRFTHEPLVTPAPTMSADEVIARLSAPLSAIPFEALRSAEGHREVLTGKLLAIVERTIKTWPDVSDADAYLFSYALYLLAKWRETCAYPLVLRWLTLPDGGAHELTGDIVTEAGGRILASVCDGDIEPIIDLICNREADEYGRMEGCTALALLAAWAELPRDLIIERLQWLATDGLEREPSGAWDGLALACVEIEATTVFPELRRAYDEGLLDPEFVEPEELDEVERGAAGSFIADLRARYPPIDDVAAAIGWWGEFHQNQREEPYRTAEKVGRNEPCPCGSGKKYKKCCGDSVVH